MVELGTKSMEFQIHNHGEKSTLFLYDEEVGGGWEVPHVKVYKHDSPPCGEDEARSYDCSYSIVVGGLGSFDMTLEELERWTPILANAMAVAAGYSSFGKYSKKVPRDNYGDQNWVSEGKYSLFSGKLLSKSNVEV